MLKRMTGFALLVMALGFHAGCNRQTRLVGTLVLQLGQSGDVQNSKVQLFEKSNLGGTPAREVLSKQGSTARSSFEFTGVAPGSYYLLAWKDLDNDSTVSDRDIVGVHGGTYSRGSSGSPVVVAEGKTNETGEITMAVFREVEVAAAGARANNNTVTNFTYRFNYDVTLSSLAITFPDLGTLEDPLAPGPKVADSTYHSDGWDAHGQQMPVGDHYMEFKGTWQGAGFDVVDTVYVD